MNSCTDAPMLPLLTRRIPCAQAQAGNGIQDLYTPEIKAANNGYDTNKPPTILQYDSLHTQASSHALLDF